MASVGLKGVIATEIRLNASDGVEIACQVWSNTAHLKSSSLPKRILCLHGFLDNCKTFYYMAPYIVSNATVPVILVAIDFPGHGKSSHKALDSPPMMVINDLCYYVREAVRSLGWDQSDASNAFSPIALVGHSLGSIIALLYAATFPEHIDKLVLLDGYGPDNYEIFSSYLDQQLEPKPKSLLTERLQRHVQQRYNRNEAKKKTKSYKSIEDAVHARCRTAELSPGSQWISKAAALELVKRAVVVDIEKRVRFRHDSRLHLPPIMLNTIEQVDNYWRSVVCKTLWLRAKNGWPFPASVLERAEAQLQELCRVEYLEGSHHFHADPDTAESVAFAVVRFLSG